MQVNQLVSACASAFESDGLLGVLKASNAITPYRFTGIYRFDGHWVKSVWLFDRENPDAMQGSDVLWDDSYCRMAATHGESCEIINALTDARLQTHAAREAVQCYVAVVLRAPDQSAFGTLCHYDVIPRSTPPDALDGLRAIRPLVEQALAADVAGHRSASFEMA